MAFSPVQPEPLSQTANHHHLSRGNYQSPRDHLSLKCVVEILTWIVRQPVWPFLDVFQVTESFQNVWGGICFRKGGWSMRSGANIWRTASRLISWNSHTLWEISTKGVIWKPLTEGIHETKVFHCFICLNFLLCHCNMEFYPSYIVRWSILDYHLCF